jgi:uncharacterized protein YjiS (DUF1127 family)
MTCETSTTVPTLADRRLFQDRRNTAPRSPIWRWLLGRRSLPRLEVDGLSEHRLRDLGFLDGHPVAPRDARWD